MPISLFLPTPPLFHRSLSLPSVPSVPSFPSTTRRLRVPTACTPPPLEQHFSRLGHVNKNMRVKACAALAEDGTAPTITRLLSLLCLPDTAHRRAAVQALGMTGPSVIPGVLSLMRETSDVTERASCAKTLAAVALYFPETRAHFPDAALDALEEALVAGTKGDPVTKIASVGCLGTLGCGGAEGVQGCERAVEILLRVAAGEDVATAAVAVGAVAQVGNNCDEERKEKVVQALERICEGQGGEEGGEGYIREMAAAHLDQLVGGTRLPGESQT